MIVSSFLYTDTLLTGHSVVCRRDIVAEFHSVDFIHEARLTHLVVYDSC